jgi:hypothetical protein
MFVVLKMPNELGQWDGTEILNGEDKVVGIVQEVADCTEGVPKIKVRWPNGTKRESRWATDYLVVGRVHERN